ncbi:hypothetical protein AK830_g2630 [Neonectria ditissima]|uniref:Uncharacterized protein n=1 Tax=Neonectria ditissima TaxID=78410 RepID=A0A0N8H892_9HYPO|nr:hypothetical protein AK830_g2630 [Neonectria ditissima]
MVAVCLMDAPTLHLKPTFSPPPDFKPLVIPEDWMPGDRSPGSGLRQVMLGLTNHQIHPPNSIFDATIKAHETGKILATEDPFSATTLARNVILAAWEDKVSVDVQLANQVQATDWIGHVSDWNTNAHQERDILVNQVNKTALEYGKLMADRFSLQLHRAYLASIIQKFRHDDTAYISSQKNEELRCAIIDERRHWRALQAKLERVEAIIADHMAMYAQRAAMEEAFASEKQALESYKQTRHANEQAAAANRMARSSGQLAKIATVVVPCTIVASILSMNGDFAAGERLFFVYWVISLPVTFVLLGWVLQKDISAWIRRDGERAIAAPDEEKSGSISG